MTRILRNFCVLSLALIMPGCSSILGGAGGDLSSGAMKPVNLYADSIGYNLVKGARTSLGAKETRQVMDSLLSNLGDSTTWRLGQLRDSLLGDRTRRGIEAMRETLLGDATRRDLVKIKNSVLDTNLQNYISQILKDLDSSAGEAGAGIRDSLLGPGSNILIKAIIDTAMNDLQSRLKYEVYPDMQANLSFVEKNATWLIIIIGIAAIAVVGFYWRQRDKYLRMAKMLTYHISELPDAASKESLKTNISRNAKMIGIEDDLRELLMKQGLLG
ncbi:MAG: hypothetical protein ACLP05_01150 [Candidatus Kryptoniota bacterium]